MSESEINPLDYAVAFAFPTTKTIGSLVVMQMGTHPDRWIVRRGLRILTSDAEWILMPDVELYSSEIDLDLVTFERDEAIAMAHGLAQTL